MNSIEISGLGKSFKDRLVLDCISLNVHEGEIFGLLGPSGAGKTTLIKILTGQLKADEGTAMIFGKPCYLLGDKEYKKIGMLLDQSGVYERLSCYDNLLLFARIYNVPKERINEVLSEVGLIVAAKILAGKLSKGMKSRLALARALLHKPQLLFR